MNITAKEFLRMSFDPKNQHQVRLPVICKDGFTVSIQGGTEFHYCSPRRHCCEFENVELGFPSQYDALIEEYADGYDYTRTVYGYVPVEVVEKLVEKHGGIVDVKIC